MIPRFKFFVIVCFCLSCTSKNPPCPYHAIKWSEEHSIASEYYRTKLNFDLGGDINTYFNKIGKGSIDLKVKSELDDLSKNLSTGHIKHDVHFVEKWNTLVSDICGKLDLIANDNLSDSSKLQLEQDLLISVKSFYKNLTNLQPSADQITLGHPGPKPKGKKKNTQTYTYKSRIEDNGGRGIAHVEIYCPNCIDQQVKTDLNGNFTLQAEFPLEDEFWKSTLTLLKDNKSDTKTINWREHQPQPIKF